MDTAQRIISEPRRYQTEKNCSIWRFRRVLNIRSHHINCKLYGTIYYDTSLTVELLTQWNIMIKLLSFIDKIYLVVFEKHSAKLHRYKISLIGHIEDFRLSIRWQVCRLGAHYSPIGDVQNYLMTPTIIHKKPTEHHSLNHDSFFETIWNLCPEIYLINLIGQCFISNNEISDSLLSNCIQRLTNRLFF